jgi:hypothetical protein
MKLVIERHGDEVAVAHTFIQNGDVMCDPEIVFAIPVWEAIEITQHPVGQYRRKYQMDGSVKRVNVNFERNVHPLVSLWARNLKAQGYHHMTCVVRSITHPRSAAA